MALVQGWQWGMKGGKGRIKVVEKEHSISTGLASADEKR